MAAYVIAILEVTDPEAYERYKAAAPATIAAAGGRYVARGARSRPSRARTTAVAS